MLNLYGHAFTEGGLSLIPLPATSSSDCSEPVYKQTHGENNGGQNKVVLLFGDDVPCKTSLKDAFVNYIYQTKVNHHYRYALLDINALEYDPRIKVYIFNRTEKTLLPFNVILIDVPALGGVNSAESDIKTLMNLEQFLQEEFKCTTVSAVNLVAPSSSSFFRPFINTYNLLNISFEKLDTLAQIFVTNSPAHIPFISSLRKVKVSYNNLFTFYTETHKSDDDGQFLSHIYYHYDYLGVDDFFYELRSIPSSNMCLIKKVESGLVNPADISRLRIVNQFSETRGHRFGFGFRQLNMKVNMNDESNRVQVLSLGKEYDKPSKVILLFGNKLSGKSTIATAIANRLFGVKFRDNFRLLIDDNLICRFGIKENLKETTQTTAYCFNSIPGLKFSCNFKLIDAEGFDIHDRQSNKMIVSRIANLMKTLCKTDGSCTTFIIYAAPGMQNDLPESFKTIHKQIMRLIGDNMNKIFLLDAFALNQRSPVPKVLKKLETTKVKVFTFDSRTSPISVGDGKPKSKETYKEIIDDINWVIENKTLENFLRNILF